MTITRNLASSIGKNNRKGVVLIVGAGSGIGFQIAKRFAVDDRYHACLCRRQDGDMLNRHVREILEKSGSASGHLVDISKNDGRMEDLVNEIENDIGPIHVAIYNIGAQFGYRSLDDTTYKQFELGWRLGTFGLFRLAKVVAPKMVSRGHGSILVTSSTAAARGNAGQHSHAAAMGGRRLLCQSLNAEYASKGIHIGHILIDGPVDAPDTLGKMMGNKWDQFKQSRGTNGIISPSSVADSFHFLAHQPPNAWTFELDIRTKQDVPWWNTGKL